MRGILAQLVTAYGYETHIPAIAGLIGDVFGPMSKQMRGMVAYAIAEGIGGRLASIEREVCTQCGVGVLARSRNTCVCPRCGSALRQAMPDEARTDGFTG